MTLKTVNLKIIADSGQCFRWLALDSNTYLVGDGQSSMVVTQHSPLEVCIQTTFGGHKDWSAYFDSATNYTELEATLLAEDRRLEPIINASRGLRLLRQDPLEVLVTFIMSANNHIPRIRQFMFRLCESYGDEIGEYQGHVLYAFPDLAKLATLQESEFQQLGAGYRSRYLAETLHRIAQDPDYPRWGELSDVQLRERLMSLMGVGRKVADCVALFGYGRWSSFPVDTWIKQLAVPWLGLSEKATDKQILEAFTARYGANRGLVQQYLFYYYRIYGGLS